MVSASPVDLNSGEIFHSAGPKLIDLPSSSQYCMHDVAGARSDEHLTSFDL